MDGVRTCDKTTTPSFDRWISVSRPSAPTSTAPLKAPMVFSGNLALYPRWAIACGLRFPDTSLRANAKLAVSLVSIHWQNRIVLGFLTCGEVCPGTEQRLLYQLVQLFCQSLKNGRHSYNHVFENRSLYVERAVCLHFDCCRDERVAPSGVSLTLRSFRNYARRRTKSIA